MGDKFRKGPDQQTHTEGIFRAPYPSLDQKFLWTIPGEIFLDYDNQ